MKKNWIKFLIIFISFLLYTNPAGAKPFKRAMVISGGYLSPGVGLGLIAGAKAGGYDPDIVIFTCGASMAAALYGGYGSIESALAFARSREHYDLIRSILKIDVRAAPMLLKEIHRDSNRPGKIPQFFKGNLLKVPEVLPEWMPNKKFQVSDKRPRLIVQAARAYFKPQHVGMTFGKNVLFQQVYFTDPETAKHLKGRRSDIKNTFPESFVDSVTEVVTSATLVEAYRASISDPYYINPSRIGNSYCFTGALDLFPIEMAKDLADEVMVTTPSTAYAAHDVLAIYNTFGFNQQTAAFNASRYADVIYIDPAQVPAFQPHLFGLFFQRGLPGTAAQFAVGVDAQYLDAFYAGYRAAERPRK